MTLEELIRDAAARGNITHLSLVPIHKGAKQTGWNAVVSTAVGGNAFAEDADPVNALCKAFKSAPKPRTRVSKPKDLQTDDARDAAGPQDKTGDDMDFG